MGSLRTVGLSFLSASLASLGCAAGAEDPPMTTAAGETGTDEDGAPIDDTGAVEEDTAPPLEYPAGPYGKAVGSVMPNIAWEGYRDGTGEWTKITLLDYFDPDGSRGIRAIKIGAAALW